MTSKCEFEININELGMIMIDCKKHSRKTKGRYLRKKCLEELQIRLDNRFWWLLK